MASIGSLVTLLSLASDAFVQQSVSYPLRMDSQGDNTAGIPYAQSLESYNSTPEGAPYASQPLMAAVKRRSVTWRFGQKAFGFDCGGEVVWARALD